MKLTIKVSIITLLCVTIWSSCTKLDEGVYDQQVAADFYATTEGANSALAGIYGELRGDWNGKGIAGADRGWFDLNESCTDEMMIPTRADGAWADNGIWRAMYQHTWNSSQEFINNTWNWLYRAVFKANLAIEMLTASKADPAKIAEAKILRAYFYYMLIDGWGKVPFYTENNITIDKIPQNSRTEIYNFIIKEITDNVEKLSATKGGEFYGRFNKWAAYALLAKVQLNAQVYTGTTKWVETIAACDKIINEGGYSLHPTYFSLTGDALFPADRCPDNEVILAVFVDGNLAPRNIIGIRSLKGPHGQALFGFSTWNGTTVHQDFVNKYGTNDVRKNQWLLGPQAGGVNYTLNISSITSAGVDEGARNAKFFPLAPYNGGTSSNDFPVYRYADILLMKAEALAWQSNFAAAKPLVDQVRARAGAGALSVDPTLTDIYDERGRELCWEGHRRQDMIRFGTFAAAHDFKPVSSNTYKLFPIPAPAISANPGLVQNAGY